MSQDVVNFGGAEAVMEFGVVKKVSSAAFYDSQMEGIFSLAYESISVDALPTFVDSDNETDKSFSFYLHDNPTASYMIMPGFEQSGYTKVATHNVIEETYWNLNLTSISESRKALALKHGIPPCPVSPQPDIDTSIHAARAQSCMRRVGCSNASQGGVSGINENESAKGAELKLTLQLQYDPLAQQVAADALALNGQRMQRQLAAVEPADCRTCL